MNAVIKYPGNKWRTAKWIISHFPPHHSYLEPFFGSGGVFFNKPRSNIETINDLDGEVVNLFEWIRKDPEILAHTIRWTPYARAEYDRAFEHQYTVGRVIQQNQLFAGNPYLHQAHMYVTHRCPDGSTGLAHFAGFQIVR